MKKIFVLLAAAAMWVGCGPTDQGGTGSTGGMQRDTGTGSSQTNQTNSATQGQQGSQPQQPQTTPEQ